MFFFKVTFWNSVYDRNSNIFTIHKHCPTTSVMENWFPSIVPRGVLFSCRGYLFPRKNILPGELLSQEKSTGEYLYPGNKYWGVLILGSTFFLWHRPCWVVNLISYCLFVTDRMIAMSFPSSGKTSMYRNPISVGFLHSFFVEILSAYMIWINDLVAKYQSFLYIFTIFTKVSLFNHQKSLNRLVHQYFIHFRKLQDFSTQNTLAITRFITCVVSNSPVIFLTLKDDKYRLFSIQWSISLPLFFFDF